MMFSNLEEASRREVQKWLMDSIPELTAYQKEVIQDVYEDITRSSCLYFYKETDSQKVSFWWRLTIVIFPLAWLTLFIGLPLNMLFTGQWGYTKTFHDKVIRPWWRRLNIY